MRFRFAEADRAVYGGDWYELDPYNLSKVDCGLLEELEDATGMTALGDLPEQLQRKSIKAMRAFMWLTLRVAGQRQNFDRFRPNVLAAEFDATKAELAELEKLAGDGQGNAAGPSRATRRAPAKTAGIRATARKRSGS